MDLQLPSFAILLCLFFFAFTVLNMLKRSSKAVKSTSKLPPGPWKLPIMGNLHQLLIPFPHHALRDLARKYGPLMYIRIGQLPTVVVSSPEYAREVLRTHESNFANRPLSLLSEILLYNSTDIVFTPYGEYWRQVRKICTQELLSAARVESFRPIREQEMQNLVERIASNVGSAINITERIFSSTYTITGRAAFGKKNKDQEEFMSIVKESTKIAAGFNLGDVFPSFGFLDPLIFGTRAKLEKLRQKSDRIVEDIIKEHIKEKPDATSGDGEIVTEDLVDVLLKFHNKDLGFALTTDNLKAIIFDIFSAGTETSATALDWAMVELMRNPRIMKKAQNEVREVFYRRGSVDETAISEMPYLKSVVKETLRLHPSAPLLPPRECGEKCEINDYEIPMKTRVIVNAWALGRDPMYWTEPESFTPERFLDNSIDYKGTNFEYIPFGSGRRICPGMSFGMINVELPLAIFLYHFDWKLPSGMKHEDLDMTESFGLSVRRKDDLHLIPIAHDLSSIEKSSRKIK